ncbi:MAG: serine hydrolase [Acidobacteriota bacterium]
MRKLGLFTLLPLLLSATHLQAQPVAGTIDQCILNPKSTKVSVVDGEWHLGGALTYRGTKSEGLLINVRMVNSVFEDANDKTRPKGFDADANTDKFIKQIPDYVAHGVRAFTLCLQGGHPGYEGAVNSAFNPDGSLQGAYLKRVRKVIEACDRHGAVVILGCYYQRQDQILQDEDAVRAGVTNVAKWIKDSGFTNVMLEVANEFAHAGFDHKILKSSQGEAELIALAKKTAPELLVSTSGMGSGTLPDEVAKASDFLLIHFNTTKLEDIPARIAALKKHGKPIVCNEDDKVGDEGAKAADLCVAGGASWGFMHSAVNQNFPRLSFNGAADDPIVYAMLKRLTTAKKETYFPPPESQGGWRKLDRPEDIRRLAGMDPDKLAELKEWLLKSDKRDFAAVVIRNGYVVLEVERGNSAKTDSRRVASVSKAVCATVLAIASEESQHGRTPRKMTFADPAFDFIPWARPLSDPRKAKITVKQLLNHTSGICPEALKEHSDRTWEKILGHTDDPVAAQLAFEPGTACGYSTHAFFHAALVCETVTGKPYDEFAIEMLFKPIGVEKWTFQYFEGSDEIGKHPSHGIGMPARDLARIAYCMMRNGRWEDQQVIPEWFVEETAAPTHDVKTPEMRWKLNPQVFSHGWELPALHAGQSGRSGKGIPTDARYKPGSGGQLMSFVPSLDLVITRQTGSRGPWQPDEYLRRACAAVSREKPNPPTVSAPIGQRTADGLAYFPPPDADGGWRTLQDAEEIRRVAGMDKKKLEEAFKFIQGSTKNGGLLVLRNGWLVYEDYFGLGHREATPNLASVGKSYTSIAVGMLMAERPRLFPKGLDQKIFTPTYFPPEAFPLSDPRKQDIKLGQLLAMTAGIRGNNPSYVNGKQTTIDPVGPDGWQAKVEAFALGKRDGTYGKKPFSTARLWCNPGEGYSYASSSIHLASTMLRHVTGMELQEYVDKHLAKPLGWGRWGYGYKQHPEVTHTPGGGGIAVRATDMLRFGYLLLNEGRWKSQQLVPVEYVRHCARTSPYNLHYPYSLQFNVNTDGGIPELPRDAFWKSGSGGHALYVVPSLDLVVWKLGGRDDQYSPDNTGLPPSPAPPEQVAARKGWEETVEKQAALRKTLEMVIKAIEP